MLKVTTEFAWEYFINNNKNTDSAVRLDLTKFCQPSHGQVYNFVSVRSGYKKCLLIGSDSCSGSKELVLDDLCLLILFIASMIISICIGRETFISDVRENVGGRYDALISHYRWFQRWWECRSSRSESSQQSADYFFQLSKRIISTHYQLYEWIVISLWCSNGRF